MTPLGSETGIGLTTPDIVYVALIGSSWDALPGELRSSQSPNTRTESRKYERSTPPFPRTQSIESRKIQASQISCACVLVCSAPGSNSATWHRNPYFPPAPTVSRSETGVGSATSIILYLNRLTVRVLFSSRAGKVRVTHGMSHMI